MAEIYGENREQSDGTRLLGRDDSAGLGASHVTIHEVVHISRIERTILQALADGARSAEIARQTRCARTTIESHVRTLFLKLDARSRSHLVAQAFRNGIVSPKR